MSIDTEHIPVWRDREGNWRNDRMPTTTDATPNPQVMYTQEELDKIVLQQVIKGKIEQAQNSVSAFEGYQDDSDIYGFLLNQVDGLIQELIELQALQEKKQ